MGWGLDRSEVKAAEDVRRLGKRDAGLLGELGRRLARVDARDHCALQAGVIVGELGQGRASARVIDGGGHRAVQHDVLLERRHLAVLSEALLNFGSGVGDDGELLGGEVLGDEVKEVANHLDNGLSVHGFGPFGLSPVLQGMPPAYT
nr:MAG TPA: hypothetical protein [Caudoviricetes sp.]